MTDLHGDVDRVLSHALARLVESAVSHTAALARARDTTPTDLRALGLIKRAGSMRPADLSRALQLSPSATSGVIRRLVTAGLVERDGGPGNNRDVRVRVIGLAADELLASPGSQAGATCELMNLGANEREVIAAFVLRLVELIDNDIEAMRVAATRVRLPSPAPPRWS
ncbi:MAG: hypothetical protein JWQ18_1876 [Conexibacter sp.]|nr:hypothetical protein [Conexibacter sp.]